MKRFTKIIVAIMVMLTLCGLCFVFAGCTYDENEDKFYDIEMFVIHPITGEEVRHVELKSDTLYGDKEFIEMGYRLKGKKKPLPNKYITLKEMRHLTYMYLYESSSNKKLISRRGYIAKKDKDNVPKEKGNYRIRVEFNNLIMGADGDMIRLSVKFNYTWLEFEINIV